MFEHAASEKAPSSVVWPLSWCPAGHDLGECAERSTRAPSAPAKAAEAAKGLPPGKPADRDAFRRAYDVVRQV